MAIPTQIISTPSSSNTTNRRRSSVMSDCEKSASSSSTTDAMSLDEAAMEAIANVLLKADVEDRKWKMVAYPQTFIGSEAVDMLLTRGHARSRSQAVTITRIVNAEYDLFEDVSSNDASRPFDDDHVFYRFKMCSPSATTNPPPQKSEERRKKKFDKAAVIKAVNALDTVESRDRKHHMNVYKNCFLGTEAVDVLVSSGCASSRAEAVRVGQRLQLRHHLFEYAADGKSRDFADDHLFFRFTKDLFTFIPEPSAAGRSRSAVSSAPSRRALVEVDVRSVVAALQTVEVKDRTVNFKLYGQVFLGRDAVTALVDAGIAPSREDAVTLGRHYAKKYDLFAHVTNEFSLEDDKKFYRFSEVSPYLVSPAIPDISLGSISKASGSNKASSLSPGRGTRRASSKSPVRGGGRSSISSNSPRRASFPDEDNADGGNASDGSGHDNSIHTSRSFKDKLNGVRRVLDNDIVVGDRKYNFRTFHDCFVGSEAVDVILDSGYVGSRAEAVQICRQINLQYDMFTHCCGDHEFKDQNLFYKFNTGHGPAFAAQRKAAAATTASSSPSVSSSSSRRRSTDKTTSKSGLPKEKKVIHDLGRLLKKDLEVADCKYKGKTYKKTFIGSDAVDLLVQRGLAKSREDAVRIGRIVQTELGLFEHIEREHDFLDGYFFYRFTE